MVVARALRLGSARSLVEVGSLWTAAALHRSVAQSTAKIRSRQGATCVVTGLHSIRESLVLLTRQCYEQHGHAQYLLIPTFLLKAVMANLTAIRCFPPVADCDTHSSAGLHVIAERHTQALLQTAVTVTSSLDAGLDMKR